MKCNSPLTSLSGVGGDRFSCQPFFFQFPLVVGDLRFTPMKCNHSLNLMMLIGSNLLGCSGSANEPEQDLQDIDRSTEVKEIGPVGSSSDLNDILKIYAADFPLDRMLDDATPGSYIVYFYTQGTDTMVTVGKQSFYFQLVPDFVFPDHKPRLFLDMGLFHMNAGDPVFIKDVKDFVGKPFYAQLIEADSVPDHFRLQYGGIYSPHIPPFYTYRRSARHVFEYVSKSDSVVMK